MNKKIVCMNIEQIRLSNYYIYTPFKNSMLDMRYESEIFRNSYVMPKHILYQVSSYSINSIMGRVLMR